MHRPEKRLLWQGRVRKGACFTVCMWLLPLVWMALIFYASSRSTWPSVPTAWADVLVKKAAHTIGYAVLTGLWWKPLSSRFRHPWALALAWTLSMLYAASDEVHQTFVPGRQGRGWDVLIDGIGASLCVLGVWLVTIRRRSPSLPRERTDRGAVDRAERPG